jgi:hypothetical protein
MNMICLRFISMVLVKNQDNSKFLKNELNRVLIQIPTNLPE